MRNVRATRAITLVLVLFAIFAARAATGAALRLHELSLDLPASPAAVVSTDLDGDGVRDLAILLVFTRWEQKMVTERSEMDEVQGFVEVMTIVPALLDHRELWFFKGDGKGGYARAGEPLPVPLSVHSLAAGQGGKRLFALTDDGVGEVTFNGGLALVERVRARTLLAGSGVFVADLVPFVELTGDGRADLLLPTREALLVYPGEGDAFAAEPVARVPLPAAEEIEGPGLELRYPLPEARDVDGDRRVDLVWRDPREGWRRPWVSRGRGGGQFDAPVAPLPEPPESPPEGQPTTMFFGDLDGDGRGEVVTQLTHEIGDDAGMRAEIRDAESPRSTVRVFPTTDLRPAATPATTFEMRGYAFEEQNTEFDLPGGLQDLDGDGRLDLVTVDLHISVTRLLGGLAMGRVTLPMDFRVWCQTAAGAFKPVTGLDLWGSFRLDIGSLTLRNLPSFGGDFDGDGRVDFVQLGHGKQVTIHTGRPGCAFPSSPDLTLKLREEPQHLGLVRVRDLDGDGRSDLMVVQPGQSPERGVTPPARLDLYLSGGAT
ncbi:MAG TPA: VCBS repeat-containing protein [Thermoanaerobaculia bacterium]|nr:VCBS repeat-containing protein [Thermoanaerobaculia bacterium]